MSGHLSSCLLLPTGHPRSPGGPVEAWMLGCEWYWRGASLSVRRWKHSVFVTGKEMALCSQSDGMLRQFASQQSGMSGFHSQIVSAELFCGNPTAEGCKPRHSVRDAEAHTVHLLPEVEGTKASARQDLLRSHPYAHYAPSFSTKLHLNCP